MIDRYLDYGDMFVLDDNGVKAECVVVKLSDEEYELKHCCYFEFSRKRIWKKTNQFPIYSLIKGKLFMLERVIVL